MTADQYLLGILQREAVDTGAYAPVRGVQAKVEPSIREWASKWFVGVSPSGSFAKGTANHSGTDIDLFISLSHETPASLKDIYETLYKKMTEKGYAPRRQNVSLNIKVNGYSVDLVPAKRQDGYTDDHSLYRRRADTWTKTNATKHINYVRQGGRTNEIRVLKLWRNQKGLDFPSFYLELTVIAALAGKTRSLSDSVWLTFQYFRDSLASTRVVDPANSNNVISDELTVAERAKIKVAAEHALKANNWNQIVT